jgi:predicted protein tyrosine phosphatase
MYLSKQTINKYKIMSRNDCEKFCTQEHKETSIIISIKSLSDDIKPNIYMDSLNNIKDILFLTFDDVDFEEDKDNCISFNDGEKIANFVNKWYNDINMIIVHCDCGISRSAGVMAAIMRAKEGEDCIIFDNPNNHPNITCFLRTLKGFKYI